MKKGWAPPMSGKGENGLGGLADDSNELQRLRNRIAELERQVETLSAAALPSEPQEGWSVRDHLDLALRAAGMASWEFDLVTGKSTWFRHLDPQQTGAEAEFDDLIHAEDRGRVREAIENTIRTGGRFELEFRLRWPDETLSWISLQGQALLDERGRAARLIGVGQDITLRKQSEADLRRAEERFRAVYECDLIAFSFYRNREYCYDANDAYLTALGYTREDLEAGKITLEAITPAEYRGEIALAAEAVRSGRRLTYEREYQRKDGTRFPALVGATRLPTLGEGLVFFVDVSESKQAREEGRKLRQELELERALSELSLRQMPAGALVVDAASEKVIFTGGELAGRLPFENVTLSQLEEFPVFGPGHLHVKERSPLREALGGQAVRNLEMNYNSPRRGLRIYSFDAQPVRDSGGRIVAAIALVHDITERKLAERRLESSLHEKEILLREVHHRVKNNLQVIVSLLNLQASHAASRAAREVLANSCERVRSMAEIHELLYASAEVARIRFDQFLRKLGQNLSNALLHQGARLAVNIQADSVELDVGSAIPLGLIAQELATNSVVHAFPKRRGGRIEIRLSRSVENLVLEVLDDGLGLPGPLDIVRGKSFGLQLVHILAGQISATVQASSGPGTRFVVTVPLSRPQPCAAEPTPTAPRHADPSIGTA